MELLIKITSFLTKIFGVENDFTAEEEQAIMDEYF